MNDSGHGSGMYASQQQTSEYLDRLRAYLDKRNAAWLDRIQDKHTGEVPDGCPSEIANLWRCDGHLAKWAINRGLLDDRSIKPDGLQHRQIGRLTAIVYWRSEQDHRALAMEMKRYLDAIEAELMARHAHEINGLDGRWVVVPKDCVHDWEWRGDGWHRCRLCFGEWKPYVED